MERRQRAAGGDLEDRPIGVAARGCPVEIPIAALYQPGRRGGEGQHRQRAAGDHFEDGAIVAAVALTHVCPVEVSVGALHYGGDGKCSVAVDEGVQRGQRAAEGSFENGATGIPSAFAAANGPAILGCRVKVPVLGLNQGRRGSTTVGTVKTYQSGEVLRGRTDRHRGNQRQNDAADHYSTEVLHGAAKGLRWSRTINERRVP